MCDWRGSLGPSGTSISRGRGLDLASSLGAKFGTRLPNKWENFGSSGTTRGKNWNRIPGKKILFLIFGVISEIQRETFGVLVTYTLGGKIWGSDMNFRSKFQGQAPRLPGMKVLLPWALGMK